MTDQVPTYLHCYGGHGRTSTVICCHLIRRGMTPDQAIAELLRLRRGLPN